MSDPSDKFTPPNCDNPPRPTFAFDSQTNLDPTTGDYTPPAFCKGTLDYSTSECADSESNYMAGLMAEALNIAAGPVNLFPLIGIHNQGSTLDQLSAGFPLSSGTPGGFSVADAFNVNDAAWRSVQTGASVQTAPAFLGYDFGSKKAWEQIGAAQERYFPSEPVRKQIQTVKIRQGISNPLMRALQIRVDASDDGVTWTRIDVVNVVNTANLVTLKINSKAAYNKWRLVPVFFSGAATNQPWEVSEVHFLESSEFSLDSIEDYILLENRDRAYSQTSTMLKCTYDLLDVQTELAKFGINLPQTYIFTLSFADMVRTLGRPVVVGDIVELPGEVQYDHMLRPVRKWLEVTDCGWSTEGYTINWRPALFRFYAQPILPSVEHKDILGLPGVNQNESDGDFILKGLLQSPLNHDASAAITQAAADAVPQTGEDPANIQSGKPLIGQGEYDGNDLYAEDAIPPNGEIYTSGDVLPAFSDISDGHYHRQTYTNVALSLRPADRLLRYSAAKGRWNVVEVNTRGTPESHKKTLASILSSMTRLDPNSKV